MLQPTGMDGNEFVVGIKEFVWCAVCAMVIHERQKVLQSVQDVSNPADSRVMRRI